MEIAPLPVLVPVVAATLLAATTSLHVRRVAGIAAALAALASAVLLAVVLARTGDGTTVEWLGGWTPRGGVPVGIALAVDPLGAGLALLAAVLGVAALVTATRLIVVADHLFDAAALVFVAAAIGFCLTGDLFTLFVFLELMSVAAYVMVGYDVGQPRPLAGTLTFAITTSLGTLLVLIGIALLYGRTGLLNLAAIGQALAGHPPDALVSVAWALIVGGLLVKAAAVPFHFWVADAYAVAPTPVALLLAGVFAELGIYGVARVHWTAFAPAMAGHEEALRVLLVTVGALTALVGAVECAAQHHLKRLLAFATIAQVGLFLIAVGLLETDALAGVAVWIVGDGLVKASLFTTVAIVQHRLGGIGERALHGRGRALWPVGALMAVAGLAVATLPPFGPWLGKALVEDAAAKAGGYGWLAPLMVVVSALVGGAVLRVVARVFLGWGLPAPEDPGSRHADEEGESEDWQVPGAMSPLVWGPAVALLAGGLAWGLVPGLAEAAVRAAHRFTDTPAYAAAVLGGVHAPGPPAHAAVEPVAYLYGAASVLGALLAALAALTGARLRAPREGVRALAALRALHSGRIGDYAAWLAVGAAVLGVVTVLAVGD